MSLRKAIVAMPLDSRAVTQNESLCSSETTRSQIFIHSNRKQTELNRMLSSLLFQPFSMLKEQTSNFEKDFLFRKSSFLEGLHSLKIANYSKYLSVIKVFHDYNEMIKGGPSN